MTSPPNPSSAATAGRVSGACASMLAIRSDSRLRAIAVAASAPAATPPVATMKRRRSQPSGALDGPGDDDAPSPARTSAMRYQISTAPHTAPINGGQADDPTASGRPAATTAPATPNN